LLLLTVITSRRSLSAMNMMYFQLVLLLFIGPLVLHSSIAGERERRSWDLLLIAPVTKAQLVVGKLISGLAILGAVFVLMLLPVLVSYNEAQSDTFAMVLSAEGICLS